MIFGRYLIKSWGQHDLVLSRGREPQFSYRWAICRSWNLRHRISWVSEANRQESARLSKEGSLTIDAGWMCIDPTKA